KVTDDPGDGYVLRFGGILGCAVREGLSWAYAGGKFWNLTANQTVRPAAGGGAATSAWDPAEGGVVLFSGYVPGCYLEQDTYVFHTGIWTNVTGFAGTPPPGTWDARLVFDKRTRGAELFGGNGAYQGGGNGALQNDTWNYTVHFYVEASATPTGGLRPVPVNFTSYPLNGTPPIRYNWSFADGSKNATTGNASHTYNKTGVFAVGFLAVDAKGNRSAHTLNIAVSRPVPIGNWTNLTALSSSAPSPRQSFAMDYDPLLNASILFGGLDSSGNALGDTWKLANGVWTLLSPPSSPASRWAGGLVYDPVMKALILFGGRDPTTFYSDTWTYDASGWTQLSPSTAPPAEQARFITYDSADGYVFFPAQSNTANPPQGYNSYWKFQSGSWTNLTSSLKMNGFPGSTSFNTVTDDPGDGYVLLFGGILGCAVREGLSWAYAGGKFWNLTGNQTVRPAAGGGAATSAWDPTEGGVVLFSGYAPGCYLERNTYVFHRGTWTNVTGLVGAPPPGTWDARLVYDGRTHSDDLFGGNGASQGGGYGILQNDTWNYTMALHATASPTLGTPTLKVSFASRPTEGTGPYRYNWSFADGSKNATTRNATHNYTAPGTYLAALEVENAGNVTVNWSFPIYVYPNLTVAGAASPKLGDAPVLVRFHGNSSGGVPSVTLRWDFGDGGSSSLAAPQHTYNAAGNFTWKFTATDALGHAKNVTGNLTVFAALRLNASLNGSIGVAPFAERFQASASLGDAPYTFSWDFGDGSPNASTAAGIHTYSQPGNFTAIVTATDQVGGKASQAIPVRVVAPLNGSIVTNATLGVVPLSVHLHAIPAFGLAPYQFVWSYSSPGLPASTGPDANVTFVVAGTYSAIVLIRDALGEAINRSVAIRVIAPLSGVLAANRTEGLAPFSVHLTAITSAGLAPFAYLWSFGDGGASGSGGQQNHTYQHVGTFAPTVLVSDGLGERRTLTIALRTAAAVQVTVSATATSLKVNGSLRLSAAVTGGFPSYTYLWSSLPPGCVSSNVSSVACAPTAAGNFTVACSVKDGLGDPGSGTLKIEVQPLPINRTGPPPPIGPIGPSTGPPYLLYAAVGIGILAILGGAIAWVIRRPRAPTNAEAVDDTGVPEDTGASGGTAEIPSEGEPWAEPGSEPTDVAQEGVDPSPP
ncbi:MAG: PKD domain-containing protein, partial [Thermoplasmata archaeon]|nr:PKD domain-containing protein [Thermoplasmata archaeon]